MRASKKYAAAHLGGVRSIQSPANLFTQGQAGAWWDFSSTGLSNGMGYNGTTAGGTVVTDGATISLWNGQRFSGSVTSYIATQPELVTDGTFPSNITGWTDQSSAGGSIAWNVTGAMNVVNTTAAGRGTQNQATSTTAYGSYYTISAQNTAGASGTVSVGTINLGSDLVNATYANSTQRNFFMAAGVTTFLTLGKFNAGTATFDNVSIKRLDAVAAIQATAGNRPTWRATNSGYVEFSAGNSLVAMFPAAFTGDVVCLLTDGSITTLTGQSITTSYTLPTANMIYCVVRSTMSAAELQALKNWMTQQARSFFLIP